MPSPRHETGPPDLTTPEGFAAFYEEHIDAVLGFVTRRVADPHLAADLTADIFLAAMGSARGYRPDRGAPVAWVFGIARNVLSGHARGLARESGALARLSGRRLLDDEDVAALEERIDAQRAFRSSRSATPPCPSRCAPPSTWSCSTSSPRPKPPRPSASPRRRSASACTGPGAPWAPRAP